MIKAKLRKQDQIAIDLRAWADEIERGWSAVAGKSLRLLASQVEALESSPSTLIAAVEADRQETADELRAAGAYPFNPAWKVSNKKRYEKVVQNVDAIADRLALGKPAKLRAAPTEEVA